LVSGDTDLAVLANAFSIASPESFRRLLDRHV